MSESRGNQSDEQSKGGLITIMTAMVFILLFFVYLSFLHPGVNLGEIPQAAQKAKALAESSFDIKKVEKPWVESEQVAQYGATLYKNSCAMCHGATGVGDGPAGAALVPKPRNLVEGKWKKGGSSKALFLTLTNGLPGTSMSGYQYMPVADRWALVQFVRSMTKNKPADNKNDLESFSQKAK